MRFFVHVNAKDSKFVFANKRPFARLHLDFREVEPCVYRRALELMGCGFHAVGDAYHATTIQAIMNANMPQIAYAA